MSNVIEIAEFRAPVKLPQQLLTAKTWLVWRLVHVPGEPKAKKIPYYVSGKAREGNNGDASELPDLASFERAAAAVIRGRYTGVGLAMLAANKVVALDFDDCVVDGVIAPEVAALCEGTYSEYSPSGKGVRAFFVGEIRDRKSHAVVNKVRRWPFGVEFFHQAGYVTVTGNMTPDCEMWGWADTLAPLTPAVLALYRERFGDSGAIEADDDDFLLGLAPKVGLDMTRARAMVETLDADGGYDEWLKVGQSLHHEFDGSDEALALWTEWSQKSAKYPGDRVMQQKWASFGGYRGSPLTAAWLLKHAKIERTEDRYEASAEWRKKIADAAEEFELRERICAEIARDARLGDIEREGLAQALLERFKAMGTRLSIAVCRKLVAERKPQRKAGSNTPAWCKDWVYVTDDDKFFRLDSDEWLTSQGFNARFNRELPTNEEGEITNSATWMALEEFGVPTVTKAIYLPWGGPQFDLEGVSCVNTYRPSSVPKPVDALSDQGRAAVEVVMRHINLLCGGRQEVIDTLVHWLAHNVQKPGVKIRWSPLIKGVEGDGKTSLGGLLAAVMGRANVRNISPKVLGTDFTGWAEGAAVGVLEEIKLTGHNRYDILNALKPFVTNDSVEIHRKGKDTYDAINTTNYVAFTNFHDALPLSDTDRRWWIVFTPFADLDSLAAASGVGPNGLGAYFDSLHAAISTQRAELRRWLLDVPIPDSFRPNGKAPMTEEKGLMIGMSVSDEEQTLREVIAQGAPGVSVDVLCSASLSDALAVSDIDFTLATTALHRTLSKMGYVKYPKQVKWRDKARRVWLKSAFNRSSAEIRTALDATMPVGEADDFFA